MRFGIGQPVRRLEDNELILGKGCYTDDMFPGEGLAVHFLRAPMAHARLTHLDLSAAKAADGVRLVACQKDLDADGINDIECEHLPVQPDGTTMTPVSKPAMVRDVNRFAGDIVAMVVADTRQQARDAAEMIEMDFESMPAVTDIYEAMKPGAPQLYDEYKNNIAFEWHAGKLADAQSVLAKAEAEGRRIHEIDIINNRVMANSLETRPTVVRPMENGDGIEIWMSTQGVVGLSKKLGGILNLKPEQLRMFSGHVGGGFGFKIWLHPEYVCVAWAGYKLKKLLRWQQDRSEAFISDLHGRDNRTRARAVLADDGKIEAYEVTLHANLGGWLSTFGPFIPTEAGHGVLTGCYDIPAAGLIVKGVMTNTPATDAYRGAGRPEANYLIERLMDTAALELGMDRTEIRMRNLIKPEQIPYLTAVGANIDSGDMPALMQDALQKADWKDFASRRDASAKSGKKRGIGLSMYFEQCGGGDVSGTELEFSADGTVTAYVSQHDNGQAHRTTLTQILGNTLGYDAEKIKIVQGDSARTPEGTTGGARMTAAVGSSLFVAAEKVIERARADAATHLECGDDDINFDDGIYSSKSSNRSVSLEELVMATGKDADSHPYNFKHDYSTAGPTFPYGCHIAEVEIDEATYGVQIVDYTVVDDFGRVVNPMTLEGQIHGGVAQGAGQALFEYLAYDDDGQLLAGSFMDYTMPRADTLPAFNISTRNIPAKNNPLGVKGSGEAGAIGAPPAVLSAVCDALGIAHIDMPATPQKIWERMKSAR